MNIIESKEIVQADHCPAKWRTAHPAHDISAYLTDESRTSAEGVEAVFFPENPAQLCHAVRICADKNMKISIAGARTGIVGGAVPVESQAVISMERIRSVGPLHFTERSGDTRFTIGAGAGVVLSELQEALRSTDPRELPWGDDACKSSGMDIINARAGKLFYPVDPTELSAQIGGTIATNASGARSYHYGPTRQWVESLKIVTSFGELIELKRGACISENGRFLLKRSCGSIIEIAIPDLKRPSTKSTAGYYLDRSGMDAVDLFVGSEGTLGVIIEAELRLTFEPAERLFATVFLSGEARAVDFVEELRRSQNPAALAIEYTGPHALELLRSKRRESGTSSSVPPLPDQADCALYLEIPFDGNTEFKSAYERLRRLIADAGGTPEGTWAECSQSEMRAMKAFRHAVPEAVNTIIASRKQRDPCIHKIGTDMAVPDSHLKDVLLLYRKELEASGLQHLVFGHIGDNHLHVNILPESLEDVNRAMGLYEHFAGKVVAMGGSVSAEHGIGRLKKGLLRLQFREAELEAMQDVKRAFDPQGLLNAGVIF